MVDGVVDPAERIRRYVDALFRFFDRSQAAWFAFSSALDMPALQRREADYHATIGRLYAAAFEPLVGDRIVAAVARAYVNYGPLHDLREAGLSLDEAIEVVAASVIALVDDRRAAGAGTVEQGGIK